MNWDSGQTQSLKVWTQTIETPKNARWVTLKIPELVSVPISIRFLVMGYDIINHFITRQTHYYRRRSLNVEQT